MKMERIPTSNSGQAVVSAAGIDVLIRPIGRPNERKYAVAILHPI
jgi:hypothetical protein